MLKWFAYGHLPEDLQIISMQFHDLAYWITNNLPECAERTVTLRKLLESKDAAVRAATERVGEDAKTSNQENQEKEA